MTGTTAEVVGAHLLELSVDARRSPDVADLEPTLRSLLAFLESPEADTAVAQEMLIALIDEWPWGAAEALEFTMRKLQWVAVREALVAYLDSAADFRFKTLAGHVLEVYEPNWPGGDIYKSYRDDPSVVSPGDRRPPSSRLRR